MFLRNYFIGFLKESGFVRFAHSILFNFQVPHSALPFGSRRCLDDSLFILPQRFPFVKGFLKIFPGRRSLPKPFQIPPNAGNSWGCRPFEPAGSRGDLHIIPLPPGNVKGKMQNRHFIRFQKPIIDKTVHFRPACKMQRLQTGYKILISLSVSYTNDKLSVDLCRPNMKNRFYLLPTFWPNYIIKSINALRAKG